MLGVTLTQRVGEFLHVLVQVMMQAAQLTDVPAGHRFKQPVDVKRLAVSLAAVLCLTSNPSANRKDFTGDGLQIITWVKRSSSFTLRINQQCGA